MAVVQVCWQPGGSDLTGVRYASFSDVMTYVGTKDQELQFEILVDAKYVTGGVAYLPAGTFALPCNVTFIGMSGNAIDGGVMMYTSGVSGSPTVFTFPSSSYLCVKLRYIGIQGMAPSGGTSLVTLPASNALDLDITEGWLTSGISSGPPLVNLQGDVKFDIRLKGYSGITTPFSNSPVLQFSSTQAGGYVTVEDVSGIGTAGSQATGANAINVPSGGWIGVWATVESLLDTDIIASANNIYYTHAV